MKKRKEHNTNTAPRTPFYGLEWYEIWQHRIAAVMSGGVKEYAVPVKGSGLAESSLYTQIRSVLRYAEREMGIEGASKLKVGRSGPLKERVLTISKLSPKLREHLAV